MPLPRFLVPVLVVLGSLVSSAHAAPQNRLSRQITDSDRASVRETVPARARLSADLGEAADQNLPAVSLYFNMTESQQNDLAQLLRDQQNPGSPHYHQWLTPTQFGARFGLTDSDLQKVQAWLTSRGLKVVELAASRNYVTVSGNVRQLEGAFRTSIHSVSFQGQRHFSNLSDPQLPTPIAGLVTAITGLNDFKPRAHSIARAHFTSATSGAHFISPGDFNTIYDVNPQLTQGFDGSGMTISIVGQTDISLSDVAAFRSAAGLQAKAPQVIQAPGYVAGKSPDDLDEAQLDVEWAGAVAPNATINFITVGASNSASVVDSLSYAISRPTGPDPIISMSYGNYEDAWGQANINAMNQMLQQANAEGITVIASSGDSGATDHDTASPAKQGLAVDFPASSPYVTSAGGTMFNEGSATGGTSYWNSASGTDNVSSAKGYIPEAVWNESTSSGLSSGGGGMSRYNPKPAWQQGLTPDDGHRDVPDISLNAASNHDGYLFCSQGSCVNGFRTSTGTLNVVGGTSVVAPALAGIFALLEQKLGAGATARLGNINPMVYAMGASQYYGNVFHDITTGNNNSVCQAGTTDCPNGGSIGYSAASGYDLATGWGSVDVAELVNKWGLVSPVAAAGANPDFTLTPTATSISVNSGTSSQGILLSVTPTNNFSGPVTFAVSADPSISATFSFSAATVNVSSGSSAQTTLVITAAKNSASAKVEKALPTYLWNAGSTASLAGIFFLFGPGRQRRRFRALLAIMLVIGAGSISGCGGGSSGGSGNSSGSSGNSGSATTTVNATPGTYTLYVSATGGNGVVHTSTVTLKIN